MDIKKYQGVIPAFYACYDDAGSISPSGPGPWPGTCSKRA